MFGSKKRKLPQRDGDVIVDGNDIIEQRTDSNGQPTVYRNHEVDSKLTLAVTIRNETAPELTAKLFLDGVDLDRYFLKAAEIALLAEQTDKIRSAFIGAYYQYKFGFVLPYFFDA